MSDFNSKKKKSVVSKPVSKPVSKSKSDSGKVKNVSNKILNLTNGVIPPGQIGVATPAEKSTLSCYLEEV